MSFKKWLLNELKKEPKFHAFEDLRETEKKRKKMKLLLRPWEVDFAEDVKTDKDFPPIVKTWDELKEYLENKRGVCEGAITAARDAFKKWETLYPPKKNILIDGLNPKDIHRIKSGLRKAWSWSYSKKLVMLRCTDKKGYAKCENCFKKCPKIFVDHIIPVGTFDDDYIKRLFVPSTQMQGLCNLCHKFKTKTDMVLIKSKRKVPLDFY